MSTTAARPPILTLFATVCGLDAIVRLFGLTLGPRHEPVALWREYGYRPLWELVTLFPTPGPLPAWVSSFFLPDASGAAHVATVALGALLGALLGAGLWMLTRWSRVAGLLLVPAAALAALAHGFGDVTGGLPGQMVRVRIATGSLLLFAVAVVAVLARRDFGRTPARPSPATGHSPLRAISTLTAVTGLLGLADVAAIFILSRTPKDAVDPLWLVIPVLEALACARLVAARADRLALGLALGLCAFHVVLMWPYLRVVPFLVMFGPRALPILAMLPLSGVGLVWGAAALRRLPDRGFAHAGTGGMGVLLALAAAWTIGSLAGYEGRIESSPAENRQFEQEQRSASSAGERVRAVARCALLYRASHAEDGYPVDLAALGPEGSRCLPADHLGDNDADYAYVYEASGTGGRDHFRVTAQARQSRALEKVISVDDGVVIQDDFSFVAAVSLMQNLWSCIEQLRLQEPANVHPSSLTPVLALGGGHQPRCVMFYGDQKISEWPADTPVTFQDYTFIYTPRAGRGETRPGYTLAARPRDWGARYFRSYLMTEDGIIHGTSQPRAATADDPEIRGCEGGDRGCFSGPGPLEFVEGGLPAQ